MDRYNIYPEVIGSQMCLLPGVGKLSLETLANCDAHRHGPLGFRLLPNKYVLVTNLQIYLRMRM